MQPTIKVPVTVQEWGNGLGVRITAPVARAAFAVKYVGPKGEAGYVLTHQPKSFDWRKRGARPHPWKQVPPALLEVACGELNSIIALA